MFFSNQGMFVVSFMMQQTSMFKMGFPRKSDKICIPCCTRVRKFLQNGIDGNYTCPEVQGHPLKCLASSHVNVTKGTPHVLLMASPCNTSEGAYPCATTLSD